MPLLIAASDPCAGNQVATGAGALAGSVLLAGFAYGLRMLQLIEWRLSVARPPRLRFGDDLARHRRVVRSPILQNG